eukprot:6113206-Prymnesium_polylepis.1
MQSQQARKHAATACPVGHNYRYGGNACLSERAGQTPVGRGKCRRPIPLGCRLEAVLICPRD